MNIDKDFTSVIKAGYHPEGLSLIIGSAMLDGEAIPDTQLSIALKTFNRHGLIAGATGTGKTKTVQVLSERLSEQGVPVLVMDLKGDLSGLGEPGIEKPFITERQEKIGVKYVPRAYPVELLSLSGSEGVPLRVSIAELGPLVFSKMLGLNNTQASVMAVLFQYCSDKQLPLIDLKDLKQVLNYTSSDGKAEMTKVYGRLAVSSISTILRKVIALEQQGAETIFGEPAFDVKDLCRTNAQGQGVISVLRLSDMQSKPDLFSSYILSLLTQVYNQFPEQGDLDKPTLVLFIDEAHLLFKQGSDALHAKIENIVKLIRSKGVGIFFCTQLPTDIPETILSQLGMKIQHALRAFTAKDRKAIKLTAENYPDSDFYDTSTMLTSLGIGEALITTLNEKGRPTPLAACLLQSPRSRMGVLLQKELRILLNESSLMEKYVTPLDRESAFEVLSKKQATMPAQHEDTKEGVVSYRAAAKQWGIVRFIRDISRNTLVRQITRQIFKQVMTAILVAIGVKKGRKRPR